MVLYADNGHLNYDPHNYAPQNYGLLLDSQREDKILEDFIKNNWALTNPASSEIGWGIKLTQLLRYNKSVVLRCYPLPKTVTHPQIRRLEFTANVRIDIGVRDRDVNIANRSQKLTNIEKYLESFLSDNVTGLQDQGFFSIYQRSTDYLDDPNYNDIYHLIIDVEMFYSRYRT